MGCPEEEKVIAFLGGELGADETTSLLGHLKTCARCRKAAKELVGVHQAINGLAKVAACPSPKALAEYLAGTLLPERQRATALHVEACVLCRLALADLEALEQDLQGMELGELEHQVKTTTQALAATYLDVEARRFEKLWHHATAIIEGLLKTGGRAWTDRMASQHVVGALGAGTAEPATVATLTAILVGLSVARDVAGGAVPRDETAVREAVRQRAKQFGAKRGLMRALCEEIAPALLGHRGRSSSG